MKTIVGIATTGRRKNQLQKTYDSLVNQVDEIRIYDNSIKEDYTDNAKMFHLQDYNDPIYFFSCDDDIIYPSDYVAKTKAKIEQYKCIVSYHGRILRGLNKNYYRGHTALACKGHFPKDVELDIVGTGVTAFRTDYFNPVELYKAEDRCMFDLVFSLEATKQNKKLMHLGHKGGWIVPQHLPQGEAIYDNHVNNCTRQGEIANEIWNLNNK